MPVPETSRQYLPDLEARWKLTRRKILELARDGKLPLWIHLINVKLLRIADKSKQVDWTPHAEVKFFGTSLHQLCEHAGKGNGFLARVYNDGEVNNAMGGILRDGCKVLVFRVPDQDNPRGGIHIDYQKVFAFIDDVKRLDNEFLHDVGGQSQRPPYLDPEHKYYSEELHSPQKDVEQRQKDLSPTREKTLLKMIGALLAMRYRGPDFEKSNGDPNVSRIAESVQQDMASAAIDDYGLKDRTLRELIPKAMEAIAENRG